MNSFLNELNSQNKWGKAKFYIGITSYLVMLFGLIIFFVASFLPQNPQTENPDENYYNASPNYPWFGFFSFLTIQSGLIVIIFYTLWVINIYKPIKFFKSNMFTVFACSYTTLVFILFNALLFPSAVVQPKQWAYFSLGSTWWWIYNMCVHTFSPLLSIFFYIGFIKSRVKKDFKTINYKESLYGMIYPLVYLLYLVLLFFIAHISIYGKTTAMWNFNDIKDSCGNHVTKGSPINLYVPFVGLLLAYGIITLYTFLGKKYNKQF